MTMALNPMDALQCFTFISDNLPSWMTRLSELAAHTTVKHAEFSEEYKKLSHVKKRRRKNSSAYSIRPPLEKGVQQAVVAIDHRDSGSFDSSNHDLSTNSRKKATGQASSTTPSIERPQLTRIRHNVLIQYDGYTQKELEWVVREIGTARNNLRRGKMSQMMKTPNITLDLFTKRASAREAAARNGIALPPIRSRNVQKQSSFDFADKQLELVQSLCESAAHQFLRLGDCSKELESAQEQFKLVFEAANSEVERLKEEKKQQATKDEEALKPKPENLIEIVGGIKPPEPGLNAIEVGDSSPQSSISIDITAFRTTRYRP